MISEETFYGRSKDVALSANYSIDYRVARLWSFTPSSSGYDVILPNPVGMKLGGIYFIVCNHHGSNTLNIKDHDDNLVQLLSAGDACLLSLSESEFSMQPAFAMAMPPVAPMLLGKWGLVMPPIYGGSGEPIIVAYWNYKVMTMGAAEGFKTVRYYLFGGTGDLSGCDQHDGNVTWVAKDDIPEVHVSAWNFAPTLHHMIVAAGPANESVYKFKPTENNWIDLGDSPERHEAGTAFALKGIGYVIGGETAKYMDSYSARTWTRKREIDYYTYGCSSAADDDKGYLTNGYDGILGGPDNYHFEYDPVTDVWTQKDDLPQVGGKDMYNHSAFMIHDVGVYYVVGGVTPSPTTVIDNMHGWVPSTDTWSVKDDLPAARFAGAAASGDYPGGGSGQLGVYYCGYNVAGQDDVYLYRAVSPADSWTTLGATAPANKSQPSAGIAGV